MATGLKMRCQLRVLVVEDDQEQAEPLEQACISAVPDAEIVVEIAGNKRRALEHLEQEQFDLAICDLAIPNDSVSTAPDSAHGLDVITAVRRDHAGMPLIVFSEYGGEAVMLSKFLAEAGQGDPYGIGSELQMLHSFPREQMFECKQCIGDLLRRSYEVASIGVDGPGVSELSNGELRAVQVTTRRAGGCRATITGLAGGLSEARTVRLEVFDEDGSQAAGLVAKIADRLRILEDSKRYEHASGLMPPQCLAPSHMVITHGAGKLGVATFRFVGSHEDLFECIGESASRAARAVAVLRTKMDVVYDNSTKVTTSLKRLRRDIVGDVNIRSQQLSALVQSCDSVDLTARKCTQHGDLHGKNVLVSDQGEPILIDYGDVRKTSGCLDPITLELSTVFHPGAREIRGQWPTPNQMATWFDLDAFVAGCPFEEYIRECRSWLADVAASDQEIAAVVAAYGLRQLRYDSASQSHATELVCGALGRI